VLHRHQFSDSIDCFDQERLTSAVKRMNAIASKVTDLTIDIEAPVSLSMPTRAGKGGAVSASPAVLGMTHPPDSESLLGIPSATVKPSSGQQAPI